MYAYQMYAYTSPVYIDALSSLKASVRVFKNRSSAIFQLITFQMFSTYAAFPFKYYELSVRKNECKATEPTCR